MATKSQSFGFDVLLTLTAVLIFNQLLYLYSISEDSSLLLERRVENNQALSLSLQYNNSLIYLDDFICNNNIQSFNNFNNSINHFLNTYVINREYLLNVNGIIYSSNNVSSVCLKKASPLFFEINSSCNTVLSFEFSIYTRGEETQC